MKFLQRPLIKAVLKSVPFVGDVIDNLDNETIDSPKGSFNPGDMMTKVIRLVILGVLIYFVLTNKVSLEDAEAAKGLLN